MTVDARLDLEFDVADRMRKALRAADVGVGEMADYLGVNRNTVGRYINGHGDPDTRTLRLWAMRTGVPLEWLAHGIDLAKPAAGGHHRHADDHDLKGRLWANPFDNASPPGVLEIARHLTKRISHTAVVPARTGERP